VRRDHPVSSLVWLVEQDEHQIKARELAEGHATLPINLQIRTM
jgi:hypothetical protein